MFLRGEFSKNVLTLVTGSIIAQAIPIAISPILTRLYTPEDFGILALYLSITAIVSVIATGRYELAIMLPKDNYDAKHLLILSLAITVLISFVSLIVVIIFNQQITSLFGNDQISPWLYFIPLSVLLTGIYQSFNYWANRNKKFKSIATSRIVQSGTIGTFNLALGVLKSGVIGLIGGRIFGQVASSVFIANQSFTPLKSIFNNIKSKKIFGMAKSYKNVVYYNLPNALVDQIRVNGINILLNNLYSTTVLGFYFLAWRMIQLPSSLIGASINQVFFHKISTSEKEEIHELLKKYLLRAFLISIPPFTVLFFFSEDIFSFIFGKEWVMAGKIAEVLTPWIMLNFVTSPLSTVFIRLDKMNLLLYFSIIYGILPLAVLIIASGMLHNVINVVQILSYLMAAFLLVYIYLTFRITKTIYLNKNNN